MGTESAAATSGIPRLLCSAGFPSSLEACDMEAQSGVKTALGVCRGGVPGEPVLLLSHKAGVTPERTGCGAWRGPPLARHV